MEQSQNQVFQSLAELLKYLDAQDIRDYRRYRAVKRFLSFKARDRGVPLAGSFELTPLCNLDCKMCYVHLQKEQMRGAKLLSVEQWKSLMAQAYAAGMLYAKLTGGECLTYPGFRELYLYLRALGVEVAVLSNGRLIRGDMLAFFKANPPACIQITLYGSSEAAYERVTGHRAFGEVMAAVRGIRDAGIPLNIAITPNRYMGEDGEALLRLADSLGLPYVLNSGLFAARPETGRELADYDAELEDYIRLMGLSRELKGLALGEQCPEEELPEGGGGRGEAQPGIRCGAGRSGFSISWRGEMTPCNNFRPILAAPLETGFAKAWQEVNAAVRAYIPPAECQGCAYCSACKHCAAEHAQGAAPGHANPAICRWSRRMAAAGLVKLQGQRGNIL